MEKLLTKKGAAALLGVSVRTIDRMRAAGQLRCVKVGGGVRFRVADLENFIARNMKGR